MKKTYFLVVFIFLIIAACTTKPAADSSAVSIKIDKTTIMPFTDSLKADTFKVHLTGSTPNNSSLAFTITSFKGIVIYKASISGIDMLKNETAAALKKDSERMKFLQNEVNYFFDEEHFLIPAVLPSEKPDKNVPDKAFYEELKHTALNGFNFSGEKGVKIYIAWSVKEQKVKVYYKCC
ncbi:MAG: hypothetical protein V4541_13280 [Bacteroidota bacterium]